MTEALIMLVEIGAITREDTEWIIEHLESIDFPEVRPFRAAVCTLTVPISKLNQTLGTYWRVIQSPIADIAIGLAFLIK